MPVIYTPGHGLTVDGLMLHGIAKLLADAGIYEGRIIRIGERFAVEVKEVKWGRETLELLRQEIDYYLKLHYNNQENDRNEKVVSLKFIITLDKVNVYDSKTFIGWIENLKQSIDELIYKLDLNALSFDHKASKREGRRSNSGRKRKGSRKKSDGYNTIYLPLSPDYGKYVVEEFKASEKQYVVCDTCFLLANLGLLYGATVYASQSGDKKIANIVVPIPRGEAGLDEILVLQRGAGLIDGRDIELPILATPLVAISLGETLYSTTSEFDVLTWQIVRQRQGRRQTPRSHGKALLDFTKISNFVAALKAEVPQWPRILQCLLERDPSTLSTLTEVVLFGGDYYAAIRQMFKALTSREDKRDQCQNYLSYLRDIANVIFTYQHD